MGTKLLLIFLLLVVIGCSSEFESKGVKPSLPRPVEWYFVQSPQSDKCYEVIWSTSSKRTAMAEVGQEYCSTELPEREVLNIQNAGPDDCLRFYDTDDSIRIVPCPTPETNEHEK